MPAGRDCGRWLLARRLMISASRLVISTATTLCPSRRRTGSVVRMRRCTPSRKPAWRPQFRTCVDPLRVVLGNLLEVLAGLLDAGHDLAEQLVLGGTI